MLMFIQEMCTYSSEYLVSCFTGVVERRMNASVERAVSVSWNPVEFPTKRKRCGLGKILTASSVSRRGAVRAGLFSLRIRIV